MPLRINVCKMKRILVIGTSGTGKSTLAQRLSNILRLPFFATDHFYWESGWKTTTDDKVLQQVKDVIHREAWILDGNFDNERELVWKQADCIIWLDYSLPTICRRIVFRNFLWAMTRQSIWSGNRMTLRRAISGIRHAVKSYSLKRKNYPQWLAELSGIETHRFHTSRETDTWLQSLKVSRLHG
jgi:adenylate kinase family enzyme